VNIKRVILKPGSVIIFVFSITLIHFYGIYMAATYDPYLDINELLESEKPSKNIVFFYPGEEFRDFDKKIKKMGWATYFIDKKANYFKHRNLKKYKNVYLLSETDIEKSSNVFNWEKKKIESSGAFTLFKITPPHKNMIRDMNNISVDSIYGKKIVPAEKKGFKFQYGKKAWEFFGSRKTKVDNRNLECIWIHPHPGYTIEVNWKNLKGKKALIHIGRSDTGETKTHYDIAVSGKDRNGVVHDRVLRKFSGGQLSDWETVILDMEKSSTLTFSIKAQKRAKNHLCVMGEII